MSSESYKKALVRRYVNNQCTPEELEEFFQLLENSELDGILEESIDDHAKKILYSSKKVRASLSGEMRNEILTNTGKVHTGDGRSKHLTGSLSVKVAAVILAVLISTALIVHFSGQQQQTITHTTDYGETATFTLPDSTKVTLNGNSEISYGRKWAEGDDREIQLQGEAFFNVINKPDNQKFIVHTSNGLGVEVLGTRFNVNYRRGKTEVVLNEGKIKLNLKKAENENTRSEKDLKDIYMEPGELAEYSASQKNISKKIVNPQLYTSWRNNKLVFEDTPLLEIFQSLEDNYGYRVLLEDKTLLKEEFTATYPADNIEILLKALAKSFDLEISKGSQSKLIIKSKSKESP